MPALTRYRGYSIIIPPPSQFPIFNFEIRSIKKTWNFDVISMEFNFNLRAERTRAKNQHYFNFKLYLLNHQNNFKLKLFFVNSECNFQLIQFQWSFFSRRASRAEKNTQNLVIFSFINSFLLVKRFRCAAGEIFVSHLVFYW